MPERKIDPKFNIHSNYRKLNIVNPYRFSSGGSGITAEYQAVLDATAANGDSLPSKATQALHNQIIADLKSEGVWSELDSFGMFEGDGSLGYKLMDWVRLIKMTPTGGLTWSGVGVKGNGSNGYIETHYNILNNSVKLDNNSASIGLKIYDHNPTNNNQGIAITRDNTAAEHFGLYAPSGKISPRIFTGSAADTNIASDINGKNHSLNNNGNVKHFKNSTEVMSVNIASGVKFNRTLRLLTFNNSGSSILYSSVGLGWFYIGSHLEDKVSQLHSILP